MGGAETKNGFDLYFHAANEWVDLCFTQFERLHGLIEDFFENPEERTLPDSLIVEQFSGVFTVLGRTEHLTGYFANKLKVLQQPQFLRITLRNFCLFIQERYVDFLFLVFTSHSIFLQVGIGELNMSLLE